MYLQVSVDDINAMEVVNSLKNLSTKTASILFSVATLCNDPVKQLTTSHTALYRNT